jgi:AraC-like DNA-binding protein
VINNKFKQSFRDLINLYRVAAVKTKLNNKDQHSSILLVALDCGFNSQASFYRAFKKIEGMTPKQYLSSNL